MRNAPWCHQVNDPQNRLCAHKKQSLMGRWLSKLKTLIVLRPKNIFPKCWDFFGRNDAKPETPGLWPPHAKSWLIGKDSDARRHRGQEEKGMTEDEMAGWHHQFNGHEFGWTPEVGDGQGGLVCCDSWDHKVGHDWVTELNWTLDLYVALCTMDI